MAKRDSSKLPNPFHPAACQRLRRLVEIRNNALKKKKKAEDDRKAIDAEILACDKTREASKIQKLKAQFCDAVHDIEENKAIARAAINSITETVEQGDQGDLFPSKIANVTARSLLNENVRIGGGDGDEDEDDEAGEGDGEEAEKGELVGAGAD